MIRYWELHPGPARPSTTALQFGPCQNDTTADAFFIFHFPPPTWHTSEDVGGTQTEESIFLRPRSVSLRPCTLCSSPRLCSPRRPYGPPHRITLIHTGWSQPNDNVSSMRTDGWNDADVAHDPCDRHASSHTSLSHSYSF
eukprot:6053876-Prymnesium_polylepis.1